MMLPRDQAEGLRRFFCRDSLRVALFVSGVRRAGKTTAVTNLALAGAQRGKNVLLIDEARHCSGVTAEYFGIRPRLDLLDAVHGRCSVDDVIIRASEGLRVLPLGRVLGADGDVFSRGQEDLSNTFDRLADELDWLLIDATSGFDTRLLPLALSANEVVLVMPENRNSLTSGYAMLKLLQQEFSISRFRVLSNRVRDAATMNGLVRRLAAVGQRHIGVRVDELGAVPFDENIGRAAATARPVISAYPNAASTRALRACAEDLFRSDSLRTDTSPVDCLLKRLISGSRIDFAAAAA